MYSLAMVMCLDLAGPLNFVNKTNVGDNIVISFVDGGSEIKIIHRAESNN